MSYIFSPHNSLIKYTKFQQMKWQFKNKFLIKTYLSKSSVSDVIINCCRSLYTPISFNLACRSADPLSSFHTRLEIQKMAAICSLTLLCIYKNVINQMKLFAHTSSHKQNHCITYCLKKNNFKTNRKQMLYKKYYVSQT